MERLDCLVRQLVRRRDRHRGSGRQVSGFRMTKIFDWERSRDRIGRCTVGDAETPCEEGKGAERRVALE